MIRKHLKRPTSGIYGTCLAMNRLEFEFSLTKFSLANCCVCYRPQRSCGKVMLSQASVILSTGEGVCGRLPPAQCMLGYTPPAQCMLGYTQPCPVHAGIHAPRQPLQRTVHILLECILVFSATTFAENKHTSFRR